MSLGKTWYTLEEAAGKYSLDSTVILKWVNEGVVRAEEQGKKVLQVNADDIELKLQEKTGI
jgi:hypothetical protein